MSASCETVNPLAPESADVIAFSCAFSRGGRCTRKGKGMFRECFASAQAESKPKFPDPLDWLMNGSRISKPYEGPSPVHYSWNDSDSCPSSGPESDTKLSFTPSVESSDNDAVLKELVGVTRDPRDLFGRKAAQPALYESAHDLFGRKPAQPCAVLRERA